MEGQQLKDMSPAQLQAALDKALADLEDLEELRRGFLGQTGVHIGMRVLKSARRQFEQEEARLKERIALLERLLHGGISAVAMSWTQTAHIFDDYTARYDAWYEHPQGRALLASEIACLRPLLERYPAPYLEVGAGTGRFAQALGIQYGIDPSPGALARARRRGITAVLGVGEHLPFRDASFGGVLVAFTLCFVHDPCRVLAEARRVLVSNGGLVLGLLPKGAPWADHYARLGAEGHPLYRTARFYSLAEVEHLLEQAGFQTTGCRSTLFQRPGLEAYHVEKPVEGCGTGAGFTGIAAVRAQRPDWGRR